MSERAWVDEFIDAVERTAFQMKAPNQWTPIFVQMCAQAKLQRASERHELEATP